MLSLRVLDLDLPLTCPACEGTGRVAKRRELWQRQRACTKCANTGLILRQPMQVSPKTKVPYLTLIK